MAVLQNGFVKTISYESFVILKEKGVGRGVPGVAVCLL